MIIRGLLVLWSVFLLSAACMAQASKDSLLLIEVQKHQPDTTFINKLISQGASINASDDERQTLLSHAISANNAELVAFLLKKGADPDLGDYHACPIYWASGSGKFEIVKLLIQYGALLDACTASQFTPLHCAAENGFDKIVELLISAGADINAVDYNNNTPLHRAVEIDNIRIVRTLVKAGADIYIKNDRNKSPLTIAKNKGYKRISKYLMRHGGSKDKYIEHKISKEEYIKAYKDIAIKEMHRAGIPASIILSLAMLQSSYGKSKIAREANNHFKLRCNKDWEGEYFFYTDDPKVRYKKYGSVNQSFIEHSNYLATKSRYSYLFELKLTDYKGWAKRLRISGYEPNPKFEEYLVSIIEENKLYLLDIIDTNRVTRSSQKRND